MALLSDSDRQRLQNNPYVEKVTSSNVCYSSKFKIHAVRSVAKGLSPREIFMEADIDLSLFGEDYPKKCLQRWTKIVNIHGENGLKAERRGSGASGRPKGKKFKSDEEELAYLRAENDFLKKLHALAAKYEKKKNFR